MATSPTIDIYKTKTKALSGCKKLHNQGYKGSSVTVCVIDSGVNPHVEFGNRLLLDKCKSFAKGDVALFDEGSIGHGTHVASLIAGANCGIAPEAKIISYKVIGGEGAAWNQDIINALNYIYNVGYEFIDIINMSLGGRADATVLTGAYEEAINRVVVERGIPIIVAAGNSGVEEYLYPASFQEVITVGAVNFDRTFALFSTSSNEVDIAQIGVDVWGANYHGGYIQMSGTSMASPYACGIGCLLLDKYKKIFGKRMSEPVFYEVMKMNTVDIGAIGIDKNTGAGFCTLGDGIVAQYKKATNQRIVNGISMPMDCTVLYQGGRMYSPARFIAESNNGEVFWTSVLPDDFEVIS